ncbi:MAG: AAA family ATPase, partial [Methanoregula sp.]|nr:AAA family ATPase [Methanoregula sp.]
MKIPRYYADLSKYLQPNKVLTIFGPRQAGKTTLLKDFLATLKDTVKYRLDSGDDIKIQEALGSNDLAKIKEYARGYELIAIDEAQKIRNVGASLKIMVDELPGIKIIATGSS